MKSKCVLFTALMFLIFNLTNAQTLLSGWKVIGPGGGGGVFLPTISPFDENLVLTHCDMTGRIYFIQRRQTMAHV